MLDPVLVKVLFSVLGVLCVLAIGVSIWATYDNITDYRIAKRRNPLLIPIARVRILREAVPLIALATTLSLCILVVLFGSHRNLLIAALFTALFSIPIVVLVYGIYDRYIRHKQMFQLRSRFISTIDEDSG